jgi:hypothetical protein
MNCHVCSVSHHGVFVDGSWRQGPFPKGYQNTGFVLEQKNLQGRKPKMRKITGIIYIFKPKILLWTIAFKE